MWGATILAALKAIPVIDKRLEKIGDGIHNLGDMRIDAKVNERLAEVNKLTQQLEATNDPTKVADLIRDLNAAISK